MPGGSPKGGTPHSALHEVSHDVRAPRLCAEIGALRRGLQRGHPPFEEATEEPDSLGMISALVPHRGRWFVA